MDEINRKTVTLQMIRAGVAVYSDPGRYETYEDIVVRIFCAMLSASSWFNVSDVPTVDVPKLRSSKSSCLVVREGVNRPENDILPDGPNLDEQ